MEISCCVFHCTNVLHFCGVVRQWVQGIFRNGARGEFDRMMLRPRSLILQVIGSRFELGRTGPLLTAVITLVVGIRHSQVAWNLLTVWTAAAMVAGGMFLFIGLFMLEASFCFFSIEDTSLMNVLTYGAKAHGKYPIDVYGKGILRFCTYVIPYTLIQYYPLQILLGKSNHWFWAFCPLGIAVFCSSAIVHGGSG